MARTTTSRFQGWFVQIKFLVTLWRTKGSRWVLARVLKAAYLRLDPALVPVQALPNLDTKEPYQRWLAQNCPRHADLQKMAETLDLFAYQPLISVIMPVFNTDERFLREAIESVLSQVYPHWELCIADDASTKPYVQQVLKAYATQDSRIKLVLRTQNGHISRASNSALEIAEGEFVALLDHDDLLTPDALYEVVLLLNRRPATDIIYSDEDKIDHQNQLRDPFFKPDWCPDSFLSRMYTCHLTVCRKSLIDQVGGFRVGYEGAQDYDLVLRLTEATEQIVHLPKVLYHWRMHLGSTASSLASKYYATDAARKALSEALERRAEPGDVQVTAGGHFICRYQIKAFDRVSIIIPTKNLGDVLNTCLNSIFEKTIYPNYEVLVIDNGSTEVETAEILSKWQTKEPERFKCQALDIPFNYSKINNYAVSQVQGEYLLFLNNDTEVLTPDWLNAMVEQAQRPSTGAVGALLLYPDNTIQHAGVVAGIGGVAGHSHKYFSSKASGYFNQIQTVNNYSAITAACLMCRREVFDAVKGFEEDLAIAFNDVDLCLKMAEKGYRNVYLPHVVLYHYESKSRGYEDTLEKQIRFAQEVQYMRSKWKKIIDRDPCYSPHLSQTHEDYSIRV